MDSRLLIHRSGLPDHESARLLSSVTGIPTGRLLLGVDLVSGQIEEFRHLVARRRKGEPLQYLEGTAAFGPLEVIVDPRVFIPRPETEQLFELAAARFPGEGIVVDLCTGSGALALAFKRRFPGAKVIGTDSSSDALDVARLNGQQLGIEVEWRHGNLFEPLSDGLKGRVQLVTANPPYVAEIEWGDLPVDVRQEPREALVAGPSGTEIIEQILDQVGSWVSPGGCAWVEVGETQTNQLAAKYPVEVLKDMAGKDRFLLWSR